MLYFSAHWCPPCRGFTPKLVESYNKMRANGVEFELVFASSDQDQAAFDDYFGGMPWLALPFGDKRKEQWSSVFKVSGIPVLVVLDKDLEVVTMNGRSAVTKDPEGREFPWHPKPISDASDPDGIDDQPSVVVFMETNDSETQKQVVSELEPVAIKYKELAKTSGDDLKYMFFGAFNLDGPIPRIRSMCSQPALPPRPHEHPLEKRDSEASWSCDGCSKDGEECKERYRCTKGCDYDYCGECQAKTSEKVQPVAPVAVLLDLRKGGYYPLEGEVTKSSVEKLLADYEADTLEKKSFQG